MDPTALQPYLHRFDVVYSWGVLHHTPDPWVAIRNAAQAVAPEGSMYLALWSRRAQGRSQLLLLSASHLYLKALTYYVYII